MGGEPVVAEKIGCTHEALRRGFVPSNRVGDELLLNLITDRYERRRRSSPPIWRFAEWVSVFAGAEKLTTALLDRLAHHATVLTTKGKSYRIRKRHGRE